MSILSHKLNFISRASYCINKLGSALSSLNLASNHNLQQKRQVKLVNQDIHKQDTVFSERQQIEIPTVFNKVKQQLCSKNEGRLFAVIYLCGKQFKITAGDIILVEGYWPPNIGDQILMRKVLLVGAKDFTVIGTPLLEDGLVNIRATIVEKTLAHTKIHFKKKRRKQYMRTNFQRSPNTMIRINTIEMAPGLDHYGVNPSNEKQIF